MLRQNIIGWVACAGLLAALPASGQGILQPEAAAEGAAAPAAGPSAPGPEPAVPISDVAIASHASLAKAQDLVSKLQGESKLDEAVEQLDDLAHEIEEGRTTTQSLLNEGPGLGLILELKSQWEEQRGAAQAEGERLTRRAQAAEAVLAELNNMRERWDRTAAAARDSAAPASVLQRIQETEAGLAQRREEVLSLRERIYSLQAAASQQSAATTEVLDQLDQFQEEVLGQITVRSRPALWEAWSGGVSGATGSGMLLDRRGRSLVGVRRFVAFKAEIFAFLLVELLVLMLLFRAAHRRSAQLASREPELGGALQVLARPYSSALLLTLLSLAWLLPGRPRLVAEMTGLLALVPMLRILAQLAPPGLMRLIYAFAGFYLADRVRVFTEPWPLLEQAVLSLQMAGGVALMLAILRPGRLRGAEIPAEQLRSLRILAWPARLLLLAFGVSFLAAVSGFMQLATVLADDALLTVYAGQVVYAAVIAARGLVAFLLRVAPLSRLRAVQHHRALLEGRAGRVCVWGGVALWLYVVSRRIPLMGEAQKGLQALFAAQLSFGEVTIAVGDVVAFGLTIWAAFLVSRFVRFVLGEEVYPRLRLAHGAPYAISSLLHYAMLFGGFLLALAAVGVDLNKFTVLAGAFGVGIGFGLQAIVNNFVSGLILLFERPIQIGDTVQVTDVIGEVRRIGIRSSTVRTFSGAEVIVPNADLITQQVTNWTLSDKMRRVELPVGVAYGSDPERVLDVLREVAEKHPEVVDYPPPFAIFVRFGDSSLDFELRAWVQDGTRWPIIKTQIAVALFRAFKEAGIQIPFPQREVRLLGDRQGG